MASSTKLNLGSFENPRVIRSVAERDRVNEEMAEAFAKPKLKRRWHKISLDPTLLERDVVGYLREKVIESGGLIRPLEWRGRRDAPDQFVALNGVVLVECKRPGKGLRPSQARERARLVAAGVEVQVVSTHAEVDEFIRSR